MSVDQTSLSEGGADMLVCRGITARADSASTLGDKSLDQGRQECLPHRIADVSVRKSEPLPAFGADSILHRICRERAILLHGPAAAVMQVAHPLVATGVRDHSDFRTAPLRRLWRTLDAV